MKLNNKRGVLLLVASVVMTVAAVLAAVYMSSLVTEKKTVEDSRFIMQARTLAESGANQAMAELRKRLLTDLRLNVETERQYSTFTPYAASTTTALNFIRDYAYASGQSPFSVSGDVASLTITPQALNSSVDGNFNTTTIKISATAVPDSDAGSEIMTFHYRFVIESTGSVTRTTPAVQKQVVLAGPAFELQVRRDNFAKFALFTHNHTTSGGTTVWFTSNTRFTGPVHTNDRFSFAGNPSGSFTDLVTQHQSRARFYNNGNAKLSDSAAYPSGCTGAGCRDLPSFSSSFNRGQDIINLESSFTQTELIAWATGGQSITSNGVYVPNSGGALVGGIYIRGNQGSSADNPSVTLSVNGSGDPVYTIVRSGATTIVTVNTVANTTTVEDGSGTTTYTGRPTGSEDEGILIYSNDDIGSLSGVVANTSNIKTSQVTVSSERDIKITGNITYSSYTPDNGGTPENELSANGTNNLLGIMSWGGNVRIGTAAPDDVVVHGVVLARNGVFTVDNYDSGSSRGTATLLGGVISQFYGAFGTFGGWGGDTGYGRNFVYDPRVLSGMAPPYFPIMDNFSAYVSPTNILLSRPTWREKDI